MQSPKISVIVGCYNVLKWLKLGRLNNIYNQTYQNWELILVDDGSTDATLDFLKTEVQKDARIKVFHKENGGLGSARNFGLDVATGDYICSFDVDDEIEPDMLECCVSTMEQKGVDVMMFGFYAITPHLNIKQKVQLQETAIMNRQQLAASYIERILLVPNGNGFFWNKCYRRSFLEKHNLRFDCQYIQQDEFFNLKVYEVLEKCYISPRVLYNYYIYTTGNNRSRFIASRFDIYKSIYNQFRNLQVTLNLCDLRFDDYLYRRLFNNVNDCLFFNLLHPNCIWSQVEKKNELQRIVSDNEARCAVDYCKSFKLTLLERLKVFAFESERLWCVEFVHKLLLSIDSVKGYIKKF